MLLSLQLSLRGLVRKLRLLLLLGLWLVLLRKAT
jgi:hypothetical protein